MNELKLFGDGIHDDHPAIQEMIDSGEMEKMVQYWLY